MLHDLHKPCGHDEASERKAGIDLPRVQTRAATASRSTRRTIFSLDAALEKTVCLLRFRMSHFASALMRYTVDSAIGANLSRMRRRLDKLKRPNTDWPVSRTATPEDDGFSDFGYDDAPCHREDWDDHAESDEGPDGTGREDDEPIHHLKSIHSLVAYHHITMNRILRACLLSPAAGFGVAHKLLMRLCGLILDLGKVVKEAAQQRIGVAEAEARVKAIRTDWDEKEKVFVSGPDCKRPSVS
jgi:hypothetical protein